MNKFFKCAMFFTAFLPLWITILFIDIKCILQNNIYLSTEYIGIFFIILGILLSTTIIIKSIKTIKQSDYTSYKIIESVQEKGITSEFLLSYILPLFTFDFTIWYNCVEFIIYFSILAFLCIRNNNVYINLILEIKGYKFYTCVLQWVSEPNTEPIQVVAISDKNLCANKGNTIKAASLNKPFYLIK